jgi:hypothetical protein
LATTSTQVGSLWPEKFKLATQARYLGIKKRQGARPRMALLPGSNSPRAFCCGEYEFLNGRGI